MGEEFEGGLEVRSVLFIYYFFFSSRRRHTRLRRDWSSDVCSSDLLFVLAGWVLIYLGLLATAIKTITDAVTDHVEERSCS